MLFHCLCVQPFSGICFGHCIFNEVTAAKAVQTFGKIVLPNVIVNSLTKQPYLKDFRHRNAVRMKILGSDLKKGFLR